MQTEHVQQSGNFHVDSAQTNGDRTLHFVLLDGTWNNSAAMFKRLKDRANEIWGEDLPCISLATGASVMHKLRLVFDDVWKHTWKSRLSLNFFFF
ncbi:unnamed protein product [Camellia sinensis]